MVYDYKKRKQINHRSCQHFKDFTRITKYQKVQASEQNEME